MDTRKNNSSGHRGVGWCKKEEMWRAYVKINYKFKHLGYFNTIEEASLAYKTYVAKNNKEYFLQPYKHDMNLVNRQCRQRLKDSVIEQYGGYCGICGESIVEFLSVDHINGNGAAHRRELDKTGGINFYTWLKKNNYPKDNFRLLCYSCNCSIVSNTKKWKQPSAKIRYYKLRKEVLEHYGKICCCCKECDPTKLTLDHQNNNGADHRRKLKNKGGNNFYIWLKKNNFPQDLGLRVLCWNCNCARQYSPEKKCPHEIERDKMTENENLY